MYSKDLRRPFLWLLLLGFYNSVAPRPAQCDNWDQVFPQCSCLPVLDEKGNERPAVAVVDCSSKSLTSVPQKQTTFQQTLYEFRLRNNSISTLPANAFQGISVHHLDLSGNSIVQIDDNAFMGTETEMRILNIQGTSTNPQKTPLSKLFHLEEITMTNYTVENNELKQGIFLAYSNLKKLTLDNWGLTVIDAPALLASNNQDALRSLTLLNQQLPSLPVDLLGEGENRFLEKLHISNTPITRVSEMAFHNLETIKEIILSYNQINTVANQAFHSVGDTLEKLDLGNNFLGANGQPNHLQHMSGLSGLKKLVLQNNELISIPKLENLGDGQPFALDLKKNRITSLSANDLASFIRRLKGLDLSENQIATIEDQAFSGATSLQSLIINNQRGSSTQSLRIPSSLSQAADTLTHLDLSGQQIEPTSLWAVLEKLKKLQTLILHSTELTNIPDFAFRNLPDLSEINLSFTRISKLTDKTFVGPRNLEKLRLKFTDISKLPSCLFHNHLKPIALDLGGHSGITCDCTLKNILEKVDNGSITFLPDGIPACSNGQPINIMSHNVDNCPAIECENHYTSTSPTEPPATGETPTKTPKPTIQIQVLQHGETSITLTWDISDDSGLREYWVRLTASDVDRTIRPASPPVNITGLNVDTHYHICVYAIAIIAGAQETVSQCEIQRTGSGPTASPQDDTASAETGIIVGCIVGALALLAIIAAIVYLVVIRRRPAKATGHASMAGPVQPRTFAKSELPSMNGDSKSFVKGKKNGMSDPNKPVGGGMQVVAISDGQTKRPTSGGRVGRAHLLSPDGTYEPMDGTKGKDMHSDPINERLPTFPASMQGNVNSAYENDRGSLPPTPTKKLQQFDPSPPPANHGYYNDGYADDKYDEVVV